MNKDQPTQRVMAAENVPLYVYADIKNQLFPAI